MRYPVLCVLAGVVVGPASIGAQTLKVGANEAHASIASALARSAPGDTIVVAPGVYRERLHIDHPVVLIGDGGPVIDAGDAGHVVETRAPITLTGFVLRGSGDEVDREDAGIMARDAAVRVVGNRFEDVFYGVYVKNGPGSVIENNTIRGKPLALARRGDGIRLWYSSGSRIEGNDLEGVRDLVVYFSDRLVLRDNRVAASRYGLHYMYSNESRIEGNRLVNNDVGAFLMYSAGLSISGNAFEGNRGATGIGLGLKDADDVVSTDNLFIDNGTALHLDNSPHSVDRVNRHFENAFVYNDLGVRLLPSVAGNAFTGNVLYGNRTPVAISGGARGGQAGRNRWTRNYWSEYRGFDRDRDGIGDTPFVHMRLSDQLLARYPELTFFTASPALAILDRAASFFPLLRPTPVAIDSAPRVSVPDLGHWNEAVNAEPVVRASAVWAIAWSMILVGVLAGASRVARGSR